MNKARYWLLTIPQHDYTVYRPPGVGYIRGQLEIAPTTGYQHWQLLVVFSGQQRLAGVKKIFGNSAHAEPSRSSAADEYVWKEETAVAGTRFELGDRPMRRNNTSDWNAIRESAKRGQLDEVPADIFVRHYGSLRRISADYAQPAAIERTVLVYWGPTGTGKSRRAWNEAGMDAYPKDPCTKFWCGYRGQQHVVLDEFRGQIGISHMLRWLDRYPCVVEQKGSSCVLSCTRIWITSNLDPRNWYPDLDEATVDALMRRLEIIYCPLPMF